VCVRLTLGSAPHQHDQEIVGTARQAHRRLDLHAPAPPPASPQHPCRGCARTFTPLLCVVAPQTLRPRGSTSTSRASEKKAHREERENNAQYKGHITGLLVHALHWTNINVNWKIEPELLSNVDIWDTYGYIQMGDTHSQGYQCYFFHPKEDYKGVSRNPCLNSCTILNVLLYYCTI
jgi:hypothetical protein